MTNKELSAAIGVVVAVVAATVSGIRWLDGYIKKGDIEDRIYVLDRDYESLEKVKNLYDFREAELGELSPGDTGRRNQIINDLQAILAEKGSLEADLRGL